MLKHLLALITLAPTMAFAGLRYQDDQAYYEQRWADMAEATQEAYEARQEAIQEAQYEAQLQQYLNAIAARQRYIEELLQQNDDQ
jgi:hypothetical protein